MMTANIIENGQDQLVLLSNECRFTGDEVVISKIGEAVILLPHKGEWLSLLNSLESFSTDFLQDGREQPSLQERESL